MRSRPQRTNAMRRMVAAVASLWLVVGVVLATQHEAQVTHVRDLATGQLAHAERLIGNHTGHGSDFHAASHDGSGHDECGICTALHQAARPVGPYVGCAVATVHATAPSISHGDVGYLRIGGYRLAPKTSPPLVA